MDPQGDQPSFPLDDSGLTSTADQLVDKCLSKVLKQKCLEGEVDSTQVLVGINPFPEESLARLPASPSFVGKHTMSIESRLPGGLEIHWNLAGSHLEVLDHTGVNGNALAMPTQNGGGSPGPAYSPGGCDTLIEDMSNAVVADGGNSIACLSNIYDQFVEVAQTVSTFPPPRRCTPGQVGFSGERQPGVGPTLSPEVRQRVLRTLSEVKGHLDTVKNQLLS